MAAFRGMDNSDEESQNSSEMSFNEVVTAAMATGITVWDMQRYRDKVTLMSHCLSLSEDSG